MSLKIDIRKVSEEISKNAAHANQMHAKTVAADDYERLNKDIATMMLSITPVVNRRKEFLEAGIVDDFADMQPVRTQIAAILSALQDGVVPDQQMLGLRRAVADLKSSNKALLDEIWGNFVERELPTVEFLRNKALVAAMQKGDTPTAVKATAGKIGELNEDIDDRRAVTPSEGQVKAYAKSVRESSSKIKGLVDELTGDNPQVAEFLRGVNKGVPLNEVGKEVWEWLRENHLDSFYVVARPDSRTRK